MLTLPDAIISILKPFASMFQAKTWTKAHVLLVGTVLATRKRTVTSALRIMGLSDDTSFARYHHVLNRTVVVVADSSYAALDPLAFCQSMSSPVTFITGLRMDAALYEPAPPRLPGQIGRPRVKGQRLPTLKELADQPTTLRTGVTIPWRDGYLA